MRAGIQQSPPELRSRKNRTELWQSPLRKQTGYSGIYARSEGDPRGGGDLYTRPLPSPPAWSQRGGANEGEG